MKFDKLDFQTVNDKLNILQAVSNSISGVTVVKGESDFIFQDNKVKINNTGNLGWLLVELVIHWQGLTAGLLSQEFKSFDAASLATF